MAGNCLWIALFLTLQISFVLCRSTGKPDEDGKEFIVSPTGEVPKAEALEETVAPGTMLYDNYGYTDGDAFLREYLDRTTTAVEIVGITTGVFIILSLILGGILICVCKKGPRRGHIVNGYTGGQTGVVQKSVPGAPGTALPTQQFASPHQQIQNQNIYPAVHPSN